ncbi:hypothetical protein Acsp06_54500 [Actinomycetospora sp. NBRC 106375]|uniref:hypothetical protein n=1 Tax=Actinomycetospora sp. NBRC 106375 TaxID=3032207 RepID=UPI0024A5ADEF|nr:hypothetical protein [Actinomycetospora sp. NBRC 106375]GLZ49265.1 hypothetical protein Acsp06_54500 [Actinomycetospora sp. NBRC 106375]
MGQLSFWSADARPRGLGDLEGLLCGPGRAELFGRGRAARLTIVLGPPPPEPEDEPEQEPEEGSEGDGVDGADDGVADLEGPEMDETPVDDAPALDPEELAFLDLDPDEIAARLGAHRQDGVSRERACGDPGVGRQESRIARTAVCTSHPEDPVSRWRAEAVCCALRARGVPAEVGRAEDGRHRVSTAFRTDLADLARAWTGGAGMKTVPSGFELDGPRLRLWVLAAGAHAGRGYTLGLDPEARTLDDRLLTASRHLGLGARLVRHGRTPALRIVGARRQGRLGELVGRPPERPADGVWPV